jgi:hypothetical protein
LQTGTKGLYGPGLEALSPLVSQVCDTHHYHLDRTATSCNGVLAYFKLCFPNNLQALPSPLSPPCNRGGETLIPQLQSLPPSAALRGCYRRKRSGAGYGGSIDLFAWPLMRRQDFVVALLDRRLPPPPFPSDSLSDRGSRWMGCHQSWSWKGP